MILFVAHLLINRALTSFTFSGYYDYEDTPAVTLEASMVEADVGNLPLGVSGAIMAAAFLPKME